MENEEIVKVLVEVDARSKSNCHRIDGMEKRQNELDKLVATVAVIATKQDTIATDVEEIKADVKVINGKPARRWEGVVDKVLMTALGAIVIYFLTQIGI